MSGKQNWMRWRAKTGGLLALLILAGCASKPVVECPEVIVPPSLLTEPPPPEMQQELHDWLKQHTVLTSPPNTQGRATNG